MRRRLLALAPLLLGFGLLAAGCGATRTVTQTVTKTVAAPPPVGLTAAPSYQWIYGHIISMKAVSGGYQLYFDPALFLGGISANYADAQAHGISCTPSACQAVPNDYYVADETRQHYVFFLPQNAEIRVMLKGTEFPESRISAAQLATLVAKEKAPGVDLFEALDSGVWLQDHFGTVQAVYQQYRA